MIPRRRFVLGAAALLASAAARSVSARGRIPYGGTLALHVPWPTGSIDPHRIDDATAAFFGDALFETLYARDPSGAIFPSLAAGEAEPEGNTLRVRLRPGLRFASGTPLDGHAAAVAVARARSHDGAAWLADVPAPRAEADALVFAMRDPHALVRALASPLLAIVPPRFAPERPDGTGPFRFEPSVGGFRLARNGLAAGGPSFLDAIDAHHAQDLETSLRAFESGADDIGWLGAFLHEPRPGAQGFDAGAVGWAILRTGKLAATLDAPGMAQALADGVPHAALAPLVVGARSNAGGSGSAWTGGPCDLVVRDDAPWLVEVARAIAVPLSRTAREVVVRPVPPAELAARRASRAFSLMLDVARSAGPDALGPLLGLATADDPATALALARHPPRGDLSPRRVTRSMRVGVVGEVRLQGGRAPDVALPLSPWGRGIDWGNAFRTRR